MLSCTALFAKLYRRRLQMATNRNGNTSKWKFTKPGYSKQGDSNLAQNSSSTCQAIGQDCNKLDLLNSTRG
jgi:hypothetical protein